MWSGAIAEIPVGWVLCDGQNGSPDLRNRFIVGAGSSYNVGSTGGSDSVTLTEAQLPSHKHTLTLNQNNRFEDYTSIEGKTVAVQDQYLRYANSNSNPTAGNQITYATITATSSIGSTGSNSSHENRPPYYALCFIMKTE